MAPDICPNCDSEVPAGARACPECGADEETAWSQSAHCDRLGIPDADEPFDYGGFVKNEFGEGGRRHKGPKVIRIITAVILLLALLAWVF